MPRAAIIACVDDDPAILEALLNFLAAYGFNSSGFASAEEFLEFGRLADTNCLITDFKLGGISGVQLQHRLRSLGFAIPTIVISAFVNEQMRKRANEAGALVVMSKPVCMNLLLTHIRAALDRGG